MRDFIQVSHPDFRLASAVSKLHRHQYAVELITFLDNLIWNAVCLLLMALFTCVSSNAQIASITPQCGKSYRRSSENIIESSFLKLVRNSR